MTPKPSPARILIVEDSDDTADSLAVFFRSRGFLCDRARDVREAVAMFNAVCDAGEPCYDLAILDVDLPSASGLQLLKAIREVHPTLPVRFYTAYADPVLRQRAREAHAEPVYEKPLTDIEAFYLDVSTAAWAHQATKNPTDHPRVIVPELVEEMIAHAAKVSAR